MQHKCRLAYHYRSHRRGCHCHRLQGANYCLLNAQHLRYRHQCHRWGWYCLLNTQHLSNRHQRHRWGCRSFPYHIVYPLPAKPLITSSLVVPVRVSLPLVPLIFAITFYLSKWISSVTSAGLTQTIAETVIFFLGAIPCGQLKLHELPLQRVILRKSYSVVNFQVLF